MKHEKPGPHKKKNKTSSFRKKPGLKLTQNQRQEIYQKYDGCCAYCGHGIEYNEMQVDHKEARSRFNDPSDADFWENLMPSCFSCNIRKNTMSIKRFRQELNRDIEQLKRDSAKFRLLLKYGKIEIIETDDLFYFEKIN